MERQGTEGTARNSMAPTSPITPGTANAAAALPNGEAVSRAFEAELAAEDPAPRATAKRCPSSRKAKRRDPDAVLGALGGVWRKVHDLASALQCEVEDVEAELIELRKRGLVERSEQGSPPVTHWRRERIDVEAGQRAAGGAA
jgi:hypothetical protein